MRDRNTILTNAIEGRDDKVARWAEVAASNWFSKVKGSEERSGNGSRWSVDGINWYDEATFKALGLIKQGAF